MQWIKLDSTSSTNGYLDHLVKAGKARKETVVLADYQEAGRGQGDHQWLSRSGENLLMSLLLFPAFLSASRQFYLAMMASLAICDFLDTLGLESWIKWPNDILTPGGKIAGILIEHGITGHRIGHTIIGIGLNLNQSRFPPFPVPATSVILEKEIALEPGFAGEGLMVFLETRYDQLRKGKTKVLDQEYHNRMHGMDEQIGFISGGNNFQGIIRGVTEYGELRVEQDGMERVYGFQEIKLLPQER